MSLVAAAGEKHDRLAAVLPDGVTLKRIGEDALDDVVFLVPSGGDDVDLAALPALEVVQLESAGSDWIEDRVPDGVTLCNSRGERDEAMAEWVLGAVLGARTGLLASARERRWMPGRIHELGGTRAVIVGMGSIGGAVRDRLEPFGVHVEGVGRKRLDELPALLAEADVVIQLAPLTERTRGQVDAAFLAAMPDGALFVNAGRGATADTDALLAELSTPRLYAVLDVVEPEPLPDDHPLWDAPGLLSLTSHWAGDSDAADARVAQLVADQMVRFMRGEPLRNVVDR